MRRIAIIIAMSLLCTAVAQAQSLWTSAEFKTGITKKLGASIEAEYRTFDSFDGSERWAGTVAVDYKIIKHLKVDTGYSLIYRYTDVRITKKNNVVGDYWLPRHRVFVSAIGSIDAGRFSFSLRERYQYTHSGDKYVPKYDVDDEAYTTEYISAKNKHIIRSRLKVDYDIRKCPLTPYVSAEVYNDLSDGLAYNKTRFSIGSDIKINKKNRLNVFYRYVDRKDEDEGDARHIIGIGYTFKR